VSSSSASAGVAEPSALERDPRAHDRGIRVDRVEHAIALGEAILQTQGPRDLGLELGPFAGIRCRGRISQSGLAGGGVAEVPERVELGLRERHPTMVGPESVRPHPPHAVHWSMQLKSAFFRRARGSGQLPLIQVVVEDCGHPEAVGL